MSAEASAKPGGSIKIFLIKCETAGKEHVAPSLPLFPRRVRPLRRSDRLFQFLRRAESDLLARLDLDRFAGRRVTAHARGTLAHLKDAEAADADTLALLQVLDDVADKIAEYGFRLLLRHLVRFRERGREMLQCDGWRCRGFCRCRGFSRNHCHRWDPPLESAGLAKRQTLCPHRRFGGTLTIESYR